MDTIYFGIYCHILFPKLQDPKEYHLYSPHILILQLLSLLSTQYRSFLNIIGGGKGFNQLH